MAADKLSNDELRMMLRAAGEQRDQITDRASYKLAINYLNGKQIDDIEAEIRDRYKTTQEASSGEQIKAIAIPLVQRYVAESATIYNGQVTRELVDESGEVNEEATKVLQDTLSRSGYDERMQQVDELVAMFLEASIWPQARRGMIIPRCVAPQVHWPILDTRLPYPDRTDPHDYYGHVVQLAEANESTERNQYVFVTRDEHIYYEGETFSEFDVDTMVRYANPDMWKTVVDKRIDGIPTGLGTEVDAPLQMIVPFYGQLPFNSFLPDTDVDLVYLAREISISWSVMVHVINMQSHSQMVLNLLNPDSAPARINFGPMHAIVLGATETANFLSAPNNYTDTVNALKSLQQLFALARGLSPNDFSQDGATPASGFAKLVDSLPKLESRAKRAARFKRVEEQQVWPRLGALLRRLGLLPDAERYTMRVTFEEIDFPRQVSEDIQEAEFNYKHGLSSPARDLAARDGLTLEEAEKRIAQDKKEESGGINAIRLDRVVARRNRRNGGDTGKSEEGAGRDKAGD